VTGAPVAAPVTAAEFAQLCRRLGGFEHRPRLALGVSGGADSLALVLLAHQWAEALGGSVLALTVDHRLRPGSSDEAAQVAVWLGARGIPQRTLVWDGPKPHAGIQDAARRARYHLLEQACRAAGILHLAVAHTLDDQRETQGMRAAHGSGADGLAGIPAMRELTWVRLLRPLLAVPKARLIATCKAAGQPWFEDPSNRDPRFERARWRATATTDAAAGTDGATDAPPDWALQRQRKERQTAELLARCVTLYPEGWATLALAPWRAAEPALAQRALARCLITLGGAEHPPARPALARLAAELRQPCPPARTLGGCCLRPSAGGTLVVIVREAAACTARARPVSAGGRCRWDHRFEIDLAALSSTLPPALLAEPEIGALGESGRLALRRGLPAPLHPPLPPAATAALPALWAGAGLAAVPNFAATPGASAATTPWPVLAVRFAPLQALAAAPFAVV